MGSLGNPNSLGPYGSYYKDCSQGICSIYCPQWCYIIFPPPPGPFASNGPTLNSSRPLIIIAIIGILASVFLLMTIVYLIVSACCSRQRTRDSDDQTVEDQVNHEMASSSSSGLDEVSINLIRVCKYKKGDMRDCCCSVCLSEFEEGDSLRLLPKCNHAFHLPCIDTWLIFHSNCPLCRSDIIITTTTTSVSDNVNLAALEHHYQADTIVVVHDLVDRDASVSIEQSGSCYQ